MNPSSLPWSPPRPFNGRYVRTCRRWPELDDAWKEDRRFMQSLGITFSGGGYEWWTDVDPHAVTGPDTLPDLPSIETSLGAASLFPPQVDHVRWIVRNLRIWDCDIDPSDTGCGKTVASLFVAHNLGLRPVVVCPKAVIGSWKSWAAKTGQDIDVVNYDQVIRGNFALCKKTDRKRPSYMMYEWDKRWMKGRILIFDEGHLLKGEETQTASLAGAAKRAGVKVLVLSATLAEKASDLKNVGYLLGLHHWSNWGDFLKRIGYFQPEFKRRIPRKNKHGQWYYAEIPIKGDWKFRGSQEGERQAMAKLGKELYPRMGHKLTTKDMGAYMPENEVIPVSVSVEGVAEVYDRMKEQLSSLNDSRKKDKGKVTRKVMDAIEKGLDPSGLEVSKLTIMLRAQQEIELLKAPIAIDMARTMESKGYSVGIFCRSRAALAAIHDELGGYVIHGDVDNRQEICENFQADKEHFICVQTASGGTGLSLHDDVEGRRPRCTIIFPEFNARLIKQTLGRFWRVNGKQKVRQYILFDQKSEIRACQAIEKKLNNIEAFTGSESDLSIINE